MQRKQKPLRVVQKKGEVWKDIPGYRGEYQASNLGRVRSIRLMRPWKTQNGYMALRFYKKSELVHCLVARAFIGPKPSRLDVNHKNGVKTHNSLRNLHYVTRSENLKHAFRTGLRVIPSGEDNARSKWSNADRVEAARLRFEELWSLRRLAKRFGVDPRTIAQSIRFVLKFGLYKRKTRGPVKAKVTMRLKE